MLILMNSPTIPLISSFVIRFVNDSGTDHYRGEIRHVQTQDEIHFNTWDEVTEFVRRYVTLESDKTNPA